MSRELGGHYPCKVLPLRLDHHGGELICQKVALLVSVCLCCQFRVYLRVRLRRAAAILGVCVSVSVLIISINTTEVLLDSDNSRIRARA